LPETSCRGKTRVRRIRRSYDPAANSHSNFKSKNRASTVSAGLKPVLPFSNIVATNCQLIVDIYQP